MQDNLQLTIHVPVPVVQQAGPSLEKCLALNLPIYQQITYEDIVTSVSSTPRITYAIMDRMKLWPRLTFRDFLLLLGTTLVYFATRLYHLTSLPIFVDEAIYSRWAQIALHDPSWRFISLTDGKQPLFIWVAMPFLHFIQDPLFATRAVSVMCGWFTILGLFYAGYLLKDKRTGYLAAILGILTPFLFFYDRFATMESMLTAAGIWVFILAWIFAQKHRLDVAMILGIAGGLAWLVKSPAEIYLLLIPVAFIFLKHEKLTTREIVKYIALLLLAWGMAEVIYNIQRLSPWMYMITRKNSDFVISPMTMIKDHPFRIWQNFADTQRWLLAYMTWPLYGLSIVGGFVLLKESWRKFMVVSAWFWGPMAALVLTAWLYRPRYVVFIVPFMLLYAAHAIPKQLKLSVVIFLLLAILPIRFMFLAYTAPFTMPLVQADKDYIDGWAAGNGVKEIASYLSSQSGQGKSIIVGTEGTFGLLPHGLELYLYGTPNVAITGYYPVNEIPPKAMLGQVTPDNEVYFILNNTQVTTTPADLTEVLAFKKADNSYIRLYRLHP